MYQFLVGYMIPFLIFKLQIYLLIFFFNCQHWAEDMLYEVRDPTVYPLKSLVPSTIFVTRKALNIHLLDNEGLQVRDYITRGSLPFQLIIQCVEIIHPQVDDNVSI